MAGVKTQTTMNMQHFHDFYFLQALEADVKMMIANNPELEFSKPVEKFLDDLDRTVEKIIPNMALRTFMYLYAACLGEARHARDTVAEDRFIADKYSGRQGWFSKVTQYKPTRENINALIDIFSQPWRAGYGGEAWRNIAEALAEYETTPPAAWLDHVVDLEHNNGTAFSKPDGLYTIFFDVGYPSRFSSFLDYKFAKNILTKAPSFADKLAVTPRVYILLQRYSSIFKKPEVKHVSPDLDNLTDYSVEWEERFLTVEKKWMQWVSISGSSNKPSVRELLSAGGFYNFYPSYYDEKKFLEKVEECKTRALAKVGNNPAIATMLKKAVGKYVKENIKKCKMSKAQTQYTLMPCKVSTKGNKNILSFSLPYQEGYGDKTETGFSVETQTGNNLDGDGYISKYYGDLVLWVGENHYWISSPVLEAMIE